MLVVTVKSLNIFGMDFINPIIFGTFITTVSKTSPISFKILVV